MSGQIPRSRPQAPESLILKLARSEYKTPKDGSAFTYVKSVPAIPDQYKLCILNVRAYYADTIGKPRVNDVGDYDDAAFVITPEGIHAFNANTDPSIIGWNAALGKPYAMLDQGVHYFIRGLHKGAYQALRQPDEEQAEKYGIENYGHFPIIRDNGKPGAKNARYVEEIYGAINYHRGGNSGTSSWGCQTIPPSQYNDFMLATVYKWMDKLKQKICPVKLINGPIN